jgi:hypothetical protein
MNKRLLRKLRRMGWYPHGVTTLRAMASINLYDRRWRHRFFYWLEGIKIP